MSTIQQLKHNYIRIPKKTKCKTKALNKCPQKKGVVSKVYIEKPKKPNSARRKCIKVKLSTGRIVSCHVPGIGHSLSKHSVVLVRGGRTQDLIGVRYKPIRGIFDCRPVLGRLTRRSKYGVKKSKHN